jgi:hypothetical protein
MSIKTKAERLVRGTEAWKTDESTRIVSDVAVQSDTMECPIKQDALTPVKSAQYRV